MISGSSGSCDGLSPYALNLSATTSFRAIPAVWRIIWGAPSVHADDLEAPAEAIRFIDFTLADGIEARDLGSRARRLDQRALQVTVVSSRRKRYKRNRDPQQDQSHGSPFSLSHFLRGRVRALEQLAMMLPSGNPPADATNAAINQRRTTLAGNGAMCGKAIQASPHIGVTWPSGAWSP